MIFAYYSLKKYSTILTNKSNILEGTKADRK